MRIPRFAADARGYRALSAPLISPPASLAASPTFPPVALVARRDNWIRSVSDAAPRYRAKLEKSGDLSLGVIGDPEIA